MYVIAMFFVHCTWSRDCFVYHLGGGHSGRDSMIVGFTTICAFIAYHHYNCEFESRSWKGVLVTTLCYKVCQ